MPAIFDLHTHSTASDGALSPARLVARAMAAGIDTLALTDHDTVAGLDEATIASNKQTINFINGIELSAQWQHRTIHVVGLNINPKNEVIQSSVKKLNVLREARAIKIGEKLAKKGISSAYEAAKALAGNGTVTRQHFSQHLITQGYAKNQHDVFKHFLVKNKPGYVAVDWPGLEETIENIRHAGGVAVIAHPLRYKMTATKLKKMIAAFKTMGGSAIEVVTGNNNRAEIEILTRYANQYDVAASTGSDYHNDQARWMQLGKLVALPETLTPVWEIW